MILIELGNIKISVDSEKTKKFYDSKNGFTCNCQDCINYVSKLGTVRKLINGLDKKLGIDLSKDVGQGMDELMPLDYEDHHLYVIPYYINGKCRVKGIELEKEQNGPIMEPTARAKYRLHENLSLIIINTSDSIEFDSAESVLSIWLEFKTPLRRR